MAEIEKSFKNLVKKGTVVFGAKQTSTSMKDGKAKLVVIAENCPNQHDLSSQAEGNNIPVYNTPVDSVELGYLCGVAYAVSAFAVIDDGGMNIHHLLKKG